MHAMYPPLGYHTESLCSKNVFCSTYSFLHPASLSLPSETLATIDLSTISIVLPFPQCHIVGIIQYAAFSDCLLSLAKMHLSFLLLFCGSIAHLYHVIIFHCINYHRVCIHILRNILVASKFKQ